MKRYLSNIIEEFSRKKFVFLAGPRQVGKTTIAKEWLNRNKGLYLNWDIDTDRAKILKKSFDLNSTSSILFDEIHKYSRWKNYIKGLYDKEADRIKVVVTGSARLNYYKEGGDSLFGRYELLRLHPFSIGELTHSKLLPPPNDWLKIYDSKADLEIWNRLKTFSGFPEPYTESNKLHHNRWTRRRRELLIKEDIRDISNVKLFDLIEHLYLLLPDRVGSILSLNSIKEELQIAYNTVDNWLSIFERLYICYRIKPYHKKISRSLKKEKKLYLWDWSQVVNEGAKFENMVASHLLKAVHAWNDIGYGEYDLNYFRNKEKEEVDFVITNYGKPVCLFECKLNDTSLSKSMPKLSEKLENIPSIQLVEKENVNSMFKNALVITAKDYLVNLV